MAGQGPGRPSHLRKRADGRALRHRRNVPAHVRLSRVTSGSPSWEGWAVFLKGIEGHPLDDAERAFWADHANHAPREGQGFAEAIALVGRRAGKSTVAAVLGVNAALNARPPRHTEHTVVCMAQTLTNARRILYATAESIVTGSPEIAKRLTKDPTLDSLVFDTGARLVALPCVPSVLRGYASPLVVLDELGFYDHDASFEAVRAARPCLATVPGSKLVVISSPGPSMGALFEMTEKPGKDTLVWRASAPEMNPGLPLDYLERMKEDDPIGYRQEVLAEFVSGVSTLLDPAKIDQCVRSYKDLVPQPTLTYKAFTDMSGGRHDAACLAIGHVEDGVAVVDLLRRVEPPFAPSHVVNEFASVCRDYHVHKVVGDAYGAALNADLWTERSIQYVPCKWNRSQLYLSLVGPINQGIVRMPEHKILQRELRQLQRRKSRLGAESVDHPRSGSDDAANAIAGVCFLLLKRRINPLMAWESMMAQREQAIGEARNVAVHSAA